jgi:hypothetical protein
MGQKKSQSRLLSVVALSAWCVTGPTAGRSAETAIAKGVPRTDENSRIAHRELLTKAKSGRIGLHFEGDSQTRRWGCSDAAYRGW